MRATWRWVCDLDGANPDLIRDSDQMTVDDMCTGLARARELLQELRKSPISRGMLQAKRSLRDTLMWVRALELAESRRTMPITNSRGRREADPRLTYGYRYRNRAN